MKTFKVYQHPQEGFDAVKVGFSWPALLSGFVWLFACELWTLALVFSGAFIVWTLVGTFVHPAEGSVAQSLLSTLLNAGLVALFLVPGLKGNRWMEGKLQESGFQPVSMVKAGTKREAVLLAAKNGPHPPRLVRRPWGFAAGVAATLTILTVTVACMMYELANDPATQEDLKSVVDQLR